MFTVEICWVTVLQPSPKSQPQIHLCSDEMLSAFLDKSSFPIIYYRRFDNVFDAVAHRRMLQKISLSTLNTVIRRANPLLRNLRAVLNETAQSQLWLFNTTGN